MLTLGLSALQGEALAEMLNGICSENSRGNSITASVYPSSRVNEPLAVQRELGVPTCDTGLICGLKGSAGSVFPYLANMETTLTCCYR